MSSTAPNSGSVGRLVKSLGGGRGPLIAWCRVALTGLFLMAVSGAIGAPSRAEIAASIVQRGERTWAGCNSNTPPETLSSRWLFGYALALCEARVHPERLERIFSLAQTMQDRDPKSRQYGNFRWYWKDPRVLDANAVDFCMRAGALVWLHHHEWMPSAAREKLRPVLELAGKGLTGHKVKPNYSNIAIMNAADLLLLGRALDEPALLEEGRKRLEAISDYTRRFGVHEYVSPTYTGVDVEGLALIEAYALDETTRARAQKLLVFWWTDIALNYFPPAGRLAGAQSRTYDFLFGLGFLDVALSYHGWIDKPLPADPEVMYTAYGRWQPPPAIRKLSDQYPRVVRQIWGEQPWHSRTHYLASEATLSSSAACYGGWMDMPMTIDFPGERTSVRGYFIADARHDPYGKNKVPRGAHAKAFHVDPFWTAAQDRDQALAVVIYRPGDLPTNAICLESNFVLPIEDGRFQVGQKVVSLQQGKVERVPVNPGEVVSLRRGPAVVGLRVLWSADTQGKSAPLALVNDGNPYGAARLVIEHANQATLNFSTNTSPGAVIWVALRTGLNTDAQVQQWLASFASANASVAANNRALCVEGTIQDRKVIVEAVAPWTEPKELLPAPTKSTLEHDGKDLGSSLLGDR